MTELSLFQNIFKKAANSIVKINKENLKSVILRLFHSTDFYTYDVYV